MSKAVV